LHPLASYETRQALLQYQVFEMPGLLVRRERSRILEQLVKQELCRVLDRAMDEEQLYPRLLARLSSEARQNVGDGVSLAFLRFPDR